MKQKILIICGPTATGKTTLAMALAKKFDGEIVSADSRQVYKGMDIITGKDIGKSKINLPAGKAGNQKSKLQIKNQKYQVGYYLINSVRVWMLDIVEPTYRFNVSEHVELANQVIEDILSRGKLPVVVGGTGFYLRGLFGNINTIGIPPNPELRKELEQLTVSELQNKLDKLASPLGGLDQLNQSDKYNPRRLIRAIEVATYRNNQQLTINLPCRQTGNQQLPDEPHDYNALWLGLSTSYEKLYPRIDQRVDDRIKAGAENEIRNLLKSGYGWDNSALGVTIGYRQWRDLFDGKATREEVIAKWQFAEHAYARRQMTWFNKEKQINWFDISNPNWQKTVQEKVARWLDKS